MCFRFKVKRRFANSIVTFTYSGLDYLVFEMSDGRLVLLMHGDGMYQGTVQYKNKAIYLSEVVDELQKDRKIPAVSDLLFLGCHCGQFAEFISNVGTRVKPLINIQDLLILILEPQTPKEDEDVTIEAWPLEKEKPLTEENIIYVLIDDHDTS